MTFRALVFGAGLAVALASGAASAQTAAPPAAPAAAPATMPAGTMDKKALSKECSAKADQKGLKGKPRKRFRSACKAGKA